MLVLRSFSMFKGETRWKWESGAKSLDWAATSKHSLLNLNVSLVLHLSICTRLILQSNRIYVPFLPHPRDGTSPINKGAMPACRHPDIQKFDGFRCCLSCGEAVFEAALPIEQGMNASKDYQYQRLNYKLGLEIRLVVLYPGHELDDLVFDIIHRNLLDKPVYEAVSYTWATVYGDASLSSHVSCRGKKIAITKNCESMLRTLRRQGTNRTIWVDAICIDQENTEERNHQVRLMATIYSNASQVVAYLGPTSEHDSVSINRVIDHLEGKFAAMVNRSDKQNSCDVSKFLRMPYFDRVWVRTSFIEAYTRPILT
jgi:hypothetical protein